MHTDQLHTLECIACPDKETLHFKVVIDDSGAYIDTRTSEWDIPWHEDRVLADYICQENNKFPVGLTNDEREPLFKKSGGLIRLKAKHASHFLSARFARRS